MTVKDAIKRAQNDARISYAEREHARPTVKEIFDLRKQGKIEEAYDAIRPMYTTHKGRYTTLCMFWTAADVLKLRLQQGRTEEAEKIYKALQRMLPRVEEITKELDSKKADNKKAPEAPNPETNLPWENNKPQHSAHSAASFLQHAAHRLASTVPAGSPAAPVPAGSPAVSPAAAGSSSSFSSLHFSGEYAPAPAGSPAAAVPAGSPAVPPAITGSPSSPAPAGSPSSPTASLACPVLSDSVAEGLNPGQQVVLDCIKAHPGLKVPGIEAETGIPAKSIERHIKVLIDRNLIEHRGSKKTGGYYAK